MFSLLTEHLLLMSQQTELSTMLIFHGIEVIFSWRFQTLQLSDWHEQIDLLRKS